jgi:hypothetical protein
MNQCIKGGAFFGCASSIEKICVLAALPLHEQRWQAL